MKERVCQLFEAFQHEFANLSLPCEGRFTVTFLRSSERRLKSLGRILGKLIKETTILRQASSNKSFSTVEKAKPVLTRKTILWVLVYNLGPGVLFSSA